MHVNAKRIAFLGLLLAVAMVLTLIGGYFEPSTLFFMAAAAFCTGIAVRECGLYLGGGFFIAGVLLALVLAPNKLYIITYGAMSLYIYGRELAFEQIARAKNMRHRSAVFWIARYIIFNLMFLPILFGMPKLIYPGELSPVLMAVLVAGGQAVLFVYDKAYDYFHITIWNKLRKQMRMQ